MTFQKGVKFRIYPNREQQNLIDRTLGCSRLIYQTKAGKAHGFNRGMIGRTLELLWEKFQNNSFLYIFMCL